MPETQKPPVIDDKLAAELVPYKGRWVAVHDGRVVAAGGSAREVLDAARAKHITDPLVFRVTAHPERMSFL